MRGVIFDIKRFAVHDGPGIRTTVFLKGCPLRCAWCQNPEGLSAGIELWHFESRCIRCGRCVAVCPEEALSLDTAAERPVTIRRARCTRCGRCVAECPSGALAFDGREADSDDVIEEIAADRVFYDTSGGGATLSGGEPLAQAAFAMAILRGCRERGIHTAIETSLHVPPEVVRATAEAADLLLVDLKLADGEAHRRWTGEDNRLIRANFEWLAGRGAAMIVRVPLVPEVTATEANLRALARYVRQVDAKLPVELINFNPLARAKFRRMGLAYPFDALDAPLPAEQVQRCRRLITEEGVPHVA